MPRRKSAIKEAEEYGIDLSLIESNLQRTPTERILVMQEFANFVIELQEAGRRYYAKLRKNNKIASR